MSDKPWSLRRLIAASWVLRLIGESGESEYKVRESWVNLPIGGRVDMADLSSALSDLKEVGVIHVEDGILSAMTEALNACQADGLDAARLLYFVILEAEMPIWVISGTGNGEVIHSELIPDQELNLLEQLFGALEGRESFLLALARKFDAERQAQTGLLGELFVLALCKTELENAGRSDLISKIRHVSLISDQLGYDIVTPSVTGEPRRLEIKSSIASGTVNRFFISRNELRVGLSDPNWFLVLVRVGEPDELLGWIEASTILRYAPSDALEDHLGAGKWEVAKIAISPDSLKQGLPLVDGEMLVSGDETISLRDHAEQG